MSIQKLWNREKTAKLIKRWKVNECLWNPDHPGYHNQYDRHAAILDLASAAEVTEGEVKRKIHTLRAQYTKDRKRMRLSKSDGSGYIFKPRWEFYKAMKFLYGPTEAKAEAKHCEAADSMVQEGSEEDTEFNSLIEEEEENEYSFKKPVIEQRIPLNSTVQLKKERKSVCNETVETQDQAPLDIPSSIVALPTAEERDMFTVFGEHIVNEFRQLRDAPDLQFKLKMGIQKLIVEVTTEYGMRKYFQSNSNSVPGDMMPQSDSV